MKEVLTKIFNYSLEEIMGNRFGRYSKEIIQDRALPDVRDGLKPVQRRILYGMYKDGNTYNLPYKKSAKTVGNVMGNYHPHGDSSIYDAMVRMSQTWKQNAIFIDMHGNNGSIDGDGPAAMRYTEARLSKIANEMLYDFDKIKGQQYWAPNYDDTELEPTVLPARFPNLLVNGSTGISAGYATNIPPHNLGEIIDATIKRIDSPNCRLETILEIVKGPDFPTGAICAGEKGLLDAYQTGRGKVTLRSKYEIIKEKGKEKIVITEIPFEVNKSLLVKKIDEIRLDRKVEGINEVLDESDRDGLRITIELKKDANKDLILQYLLKNTDMQISYNFNMVAIVNRRPMTLGILPILDAYIVHAKDILTKRLQFDLELNKSRLHIIEGLIKCLSILDEVIKVIRASKNKSDAENNLVTEFGFSMEQAKAIVVLQLYKLTNTDVTELEKEKIERENVVRQLEELLQNETAFKNKMKEELREIKKMYAVPRKTEIQKDFAEIKIDMTSMVPKEDVIVTVTKEGYVKRVSLRSYNKDEETALKEQDYLLGLYKANTLDVLLLFTNQGNYLYLPVYELPEGKWKELGKHVSNLIKLDPYEEIISSFLISTFDTEDYVTIFTKNGMVKRSYLKDFKVVRYSKPITAIKLKENDEVVAVSKEDKPYVFLVTKRGYALTYETSEIPLAGLKASGVKAISLKEDTVVSATLYDDTLEYISIVTSKGTGKRVRKCEFDLMSRARKGIQMIKEVKTNPYFIFGAFYGSLQEEIGMVTKEETFFVKTKELPISDRYSSGTSITKKEILKVFEKQTLVKKEEKEEPKVEVLDLEEIDQKIYTIEDYLNQIEEK